MNKDKLSKLEQLDANKLRNSVFYHGTVLSSVRKIKANGFRDYSNSHTIGSLGRGSYAFLNNYSNAKKFAYKKFFELKRKFRYRGFHDKPCVISFKLKHPDNVLFLDASYVLHSFNNFLNNPRFLPKINKINNDFKEKYGKHLKNNDKVKRLDGAIVDTFYDATVKAGNSILGVCKSEQDVSLIKQIKIIRKLMKNSNLSNALELCIKDKRVVDYSTIKLL